MIKPAIPHILKLSRSKSIIYESSEACGTSLWEKLEQVAQLNHTLQQTFKRKINQHHPGIQDRGHQKDPFYQFSPCNFYKTLELAPRSFWLLFSTLLARWRKISSPYLQVPFQVPNYWTWNKTAPQKNLSFYQIHIKLKL